MLNVFEGINKGYWESEVKKGNQGFKRTYGTLPCRKGTLSVVSPYSAGMKTARGWLKQLMEMAL